jgi:dTDP-4-dehydrorhamnose 3,5-epimerase
MMSAPTHIQTIAGMEIFHVDIPGLIILTPRVFADDRGHFYELWNQERYRQAGITLPFVQDNFSRSKRATLRGMHIQNPLPQGKLAMVLEGEIFDVAVDLRRSSPTFGRWHGEVLSAQNKRQMYVPPGFAHGFVTLSETALFLYKCTEYYSPQHELILQWDDPEVGIQWPIQLPLLSPKDQNGRRLRDLPGLA